MSNHTPSPHAPQAVGACALGCRNCNATLPDGAHYCPRCGQETALHPPTLLEFVHEFFDHYIALEGSMWRTLWLLISKPGALTHEYLAGRKRRYVLPLKLYLTLALIALLTLSYTQREGSDHASIVRTQVVVQNTTASPSQASSAAVASASNKVGAGMTPGEADEMAGARWKFLQSTTCVALAAVCDRLWNKYVDATPEQRDAHLAQLPSKLLKLMNYGMLGMMPLFAGLLAIAFRNRRMTFGEHMVFSLHVHAFAALLTTLLALAALAGPAEIGWIVLPLYATVALRSVYGGTWPATLLRAAGIAAAYAGLLLGLTLVLLIIALL